MLGIRWDSALIETNDIDIADDYLIQIGIEQRVVNVVDALRESGMGFFEVPALDRKSPSTRFSIRSHQLTVDF